MTAAKRKISVSLDADLVEDLERIGEPLSKQVNDALRDALEQRRRQRALRAFLDELNEREGRVPEELIRKYEALLR